MTATASPELLPNVIEWRRARAHALSESQRKRMETRQVHEPLELREGASEGTRLLRSYASLFDESYVVRSLGHRFEETVRAGAFKRTLGTNPDVVFRTEHSGPPLAATWSGDLRLGEDRKGLWYEVDLDESDSDVRSLIAKVERGVYRESSFGFRIGHNGDKWNDGHDKRELLACELDRGDVSVVTFGASRATGQHMLLRSEEAIRALQEVGFEQFLAAWIEWRDFTSVPPEERLGKVVSSQSMETLRTVLGLIADADDSVDRAEAMLADFLGVPNPDQDDEGEENGERGHDGSTSNAADVKFAREMVLHLEASVRMSHDEIRDGVNRDVKELAAQITNSRPPEVAFMRDWLSKNAEGVTSVTSSKQLDRVKAGRSEEREEASASSPITSDRDRTAPHLMDSVLGDLAHAKQHIQRLFESEVVASLGSTTFNVEHAQRHIDSAQDHAQKLDGHLSEFPSKPDVFRSERELLSAQRDEEAKSEADDQTEGFWPIVKDLAAQREWTIREDGSVIYYARSEEDGEDEYWLREDEDVPEEHRADLSASGRKTMTKEGTALPGGRYPIPNVTFLKKAIRAFGRAKDKPAVKAWIKKRARALGATNLIPETWRTEIPTLLPNDSEDLMFSLRLRNDR